MIFYKLMHRGRQDDQSSGPLNPKPFQLVLLDSSTPDSTRVGVDMNIHQVLELQTQIAQALQTAVRRGDIAQAFGRSDPGHWPLTRKDLPHA